MKSMTYLAFKTRLPWHGTSVEGAETGSEHLNLSLDVDMDVLLHQM
jgi:hypothetical protein